MPGPKYNQDPISEFLRNDVTGDLTEVPGLGTSSMKALGSGRSCNKITNTFELIGKYLMLNANPDKFNAFLKTKGITHRRAVVESISEKCRLLLPRAGEA